MKKSGNSGKKWIAVGIVICLVFAAGIGIGTYGASKKAQKTENTSSKNSAQGDSSSVKNNVVQKDDSDDKDTSGKNDNVDSDKGGNSGRQDDKQDSSADAERGNDSGAQGSGNTYDASIPEDDTAIHTYEYILSDGTWQEAFQDCLDRGGYLVRINSSKEYEYIRKEISSKKMTDIYFKLGGKRDSQSHDYYWVNQDNKLFGQKLNSDDSWCSEEWMDGEPSFKDGDLDEQYMDLFFSDGEKRFVWNDVPNNMLQAEPAYSGKLGYICEYE